MTSKIKVSPVFDESRQTYSIKCKNITFECTAADSGRITLFSFDGRNILTDASVNPFNFGSTFWTSPQKDWEWPPPKEVDSETAWNGVIQNDVITLTGPVCPTLDIQIVKRFSASEHDDAIRLEYEIRNTSANPVRYGHWEISRVNPGGITFYPTGISSFPPTIQSALPTQDIEGITWFHHTEQTVTGEHKLFADGKDGWIAHLDRELLFIKCFEDITPDAAAPTEAEIEIYAVPAYVEVEQQGAYLPIEPKCTSSWPVKWYLKKVPSTVSASIGSRSLVNYVREIVGNS